MERRPPAAAVCLGVGVGPGVGARELDVAAGMAVLDVSSSSASVIESTGAPPPSPSSSSVCCLAFHLSCIDNGALDCFGFIAPVELPCLDRPLLVSIPRPWYCGLSPCPCWSVGIEPSDSFKPAALARAEAKSSPWEVTFGLNDSFRPAALAKAAAKSSPWEVSFELYGTVADELSCGAMYGAVPLGPKRVSYDDWALYPWVLPP